MKRLWMPLLILLLAPSLAQATLTVGVHDSIQVNNNPVTTSHAKTTTSGSGLVCGFQYQAHDSVVSIVDFYNNTWIEIQSNINHPGGVQSRAWYSPKIIGGAGHTVSVTVTGGISQTLYCQEIKASVGNGIFLDQSARADDLASPFTSPQVTTVTANEFLWAMGVSLAATTGDTWTAGNSFTMQENQTDGLNGIAGAMGTRIVTSTGNYNSSWTAAVATTTGQWIATFSETATLAGTLLTDTSVRTEPTLPTMGAAGSKIVDPVFGTTILRVTDSTNAGAFGQALYSSYPSVNVNSTRVMAVVAPISNVKFFTLNKNLFTVSGGTLTASGTPNMLQYYFRWSGTNPDLVYGSGHPSQGNDAAKLYSYNVATGVTTIIKDFSGLTLAGIAPHSGAWLDQLQQDTADNIFSFTIKTSAGADAGFLYWKRSTDTVLLNVTLSSTNETYVDKTGVYGYVIGNSYPAVDVYNLATQALIANLSTNGFSHNGPGTGTVCTMRDNQNGLSAGSLATPNTFTTREAGFFGTSTQSHHISFNADDENYCLVSRFSLSGGGVVNAFDNEIVLVATGTNAVKRVAHHRSITNAYEASPFANISRDGRFIAFTSTWGTNLSSGGRRDMYVVRIPAPDSTPPILSATFPVIDLPSGSTTCPFTFLSDEAATVKYDTSDAAYGSLASTATGNGLTFSGSIGSLTDGSTVTVYGRGQDIAGNTNTASTTITCHVATSTADVTPPGDVSGLVATAPAGGTSLSYTWTAASGGDILGYKLYLCTPAPCTATVEAGVTPDATPAIVIPNLLPSTAYGARVKAFDTSLNPSASFSAEVDFTTTAAPETTPPTPPVLLRISQIVNTNALLALSAGTDASGISFNTLEECTGVDCTLFASKVSFTGTLIRTGSLLPSTTYCWRASDTDIFGNPSVFSNIVCGTTTAASVQSLRLPAVARNPRVP